MLLWDIKEKLSEKAKERGVTIHTDASNSVVDGDEILLSMLFFNLTENAIKACTDGGSVTLSCAGNTASVCDNGKGIDSKNEDCLFIKDIIKVIKQNKLTDGESAILSSYLRRRLVWLDKDTDKIFIEEINSILYNPTNVN